MLFRQRAPRTFGQPQLRVATPDGKCPICKVGEPDADGKTMIGSIEVAACARCKNMMMNGLAMFNGLSKVLGRIKRGNW
ncbi:MAG: hypothetical protein ACYC6M_03135 [Terriglobales bacterium]